MLGRVKGWLLVRTRARPTVQSASLARVQTIAHHNVGLAAKMLAARSCTSISSKSPSLPFHDRKQVDISELVHFIDQLILIAAVTAKKQMIHITT